MDPIAISIFFTHPHSSMRRRKWFSSRILDEMIRG
jgi:hypothetical protein